MNKSTVVTLLFLICVFNLSIAQQDPARFEKQIAQFEKTDAKEGHKTGCILFTGSSSIRMWKTLAADMEPMPVLNRGFGGSTIPEVIHFADRIILPHNPKMLVLYCGENDLANDHTKAPQALHSFKEFHKYMKSKLPETEIFFIAIKPSIKRWHYWEKFSEANDMIIDYINTIDNMHYVDTASEMLDEDGVVLQDIFIDDNLHMNAKGYEIWTKTIKPVLLKHYSD